MAERTPTAVRHGPQRRCFTMRHVGIWRSLLALRVWSRNILSGWIGPFLALTNFIPIINPQVKRVFQPIPD